jgi:hypothetical protein
MSLIVELNASTDMFYILNHLLLLNIAIFKLKCNNLIFNEIMVLNASYVCLLHFCFIEDHPIWILEDEPLIFEVVPSQSAIAMIPNQPPTYSMSRSWKKILRSWTCTMFLVQTTQSPMTYQQKPPLGIWCLMVSLKDGCCEQ